jgi:hypothetical protein
VDGRSILIRAWLLVTHLFPLPGNLAPAVDENRPRAQLAAMSKRNRLEMDSFPANQQSDEGYSEDPLNPITSGDVSGSLSTVRSVAALPAWLAANASQVPLSLKKGKFSTLTSSFRRPVFRELTELI